jgi:hypothetical protein
MTELLKCLDGIQVGDETANWKLEIVFFGTAVEE